jgi:hypothetical protein
MVTEKASLIWPWHASRLAQSQPNQINLNFKLHNITKYKIYNDHWPHTTPFGIIRIVRNPMPSRGKSGVSPLSGFSLSPSSSCRSPLWQPLFEAKKTHGSQQWLAIAHETVAQQQCRTERTGSGDGIKWGQFLGPSMITEQKGKIGEEHFKKASPHLQNRIYPLVN